MSKCRLCERKGFFLKISRDGLCKICQVIVVGNVHERKRIMEQSAKLINRSKKLETRLSRCEVLLDHAQALFEYEKKGIPTVEPLPSQIISETKIEREDIIRKGIKDEVEKTLAKARLTKSTRTSTTQANKALLKIMELGNQLEDISFLSSQELRLKKFIHQTQLNAFIEAARKAEFKGQKKRALNQYQEALYFLKNDDVSEPLPKTKIDEIENKIKKLQA